MMVFKESCVSTAVILHRLPFCVKIPKMLRPRIPWRVTFLASRYRLSAALYSSSSTDNHLSKPVGMPTQPPPPDPDDTTDDTADTPKPKTIPGFITSVLYGNRQIKEELADTYSKVLARGKYVHEIQSLLFYVFHHSSFFFRTFCQTGMYA